jgi:hypothetical protein
LCGSELAREEVDTSHQLSIGLIAVFASKLTPTGAVFAARQSGIWKTVDLPCMLELPQIMDAIETHDRE